MKICNQKGDESIASSEELIDNAIIVIFMINLIGIIAIVTGCCYKVCSLGTALIWIIKITVSLGLCVKILSIFSVDQESDNTETTAPCNVSNVFQMIVWISLSIGTLLL